MWKVCLFSLRGEKGKAQHRSAADFQFGKYDPKSRGEHTGGWKLPQHKPQGTEGHLQQASTTASSRFVLPVPSPSTILDNWHRSFYLFCKYFLFKLFPATAKSTLPLPTQRNISSHESLWFVYKYRSILSSSTGKEHSKWCSNFNVKGLARSKTLPTAYQRQLSGAAWCNLATRKWSAAPRELFKVPGTRKCVPRTRTQKRFLHFRGNWEIEM